MLQGIGHGEELALVEDPAGVVDRPTLRPYQGHVVIDLRRDAQALAERPERLYSCLVRTVGPSAQSYRRAEQRPALGLGHLEVLLFGDVDALLVGQLEVLPLVVAEGGGVQDGHRRERQLSGRIGPTELEDRQPRERVETIADVDGLGRAPNPPDARSRVGALGGGLHLFVHGEGGRQQLDSRGPCLRPHL